MSNLSNNNRSNKFWDKGINTIARIQETILVLSGGFIFLSITVQVALRYVFKAPLFGLEETALVAAAWFYLIGSAHSIHKGSYVKADIIAIFIKDQSILKQIDVASMLVSILGIVCLTYVGIEYCLWLASANAIIMPWKISQNYAYSSIIVGSMLMTLHFIIRVIREIREIQRLKDSRSRTYSRPNN